MRLNRSDDRTASPCQRLQKVDERIIISADAVGDPHQADHVLAGIEWNTEKAVELRMSLRAATRIRVADDHRLATGNHGVEQGVNVANREVLSWLFGRGLA